MSRATVDALLREMRSWDGVLVDTPGPGGTAPEVAWGDSFAYFAPDGAVPRAQPWATVVTKDYPGEPSSGLGDGRVRVNVQVSRATYGELLGHEPWEGTEDVDPTRTDVLLPHPTYAAWSWVAVVDPGERTTDLLLRLLREAYDAARARHERRDALRTEDPPPG